MLWAFEDDDASPTRVVKKLPIFVTILLPIHSSNMMDHPIFNEAHNMYPLKHISASIEKT